MADILRVRVPIYSAEDGNNYKKEVIWVTFLKPLTFKLLFTHDQIINIEGLEEDGLPVRCTPDVLAHLLDNPIIFRAIDRAYYNYVIDPPWWRIFFYWLTT